MKFKNRILFTIVTASVVGIIISLFVSNKIITEVGLNGEIKTAKAILSRLESARDFVANQGGLKPLVEKFSKEVKDGNMTDEQKRLVMNQVPIVSSIKIGSQDAEKYGYQFRVFSDAPRRKENLATSEELEILRQFEIDKSLPEIVKDDGDFVTVFRPIRLSESQGCMICHGNPSTSPWGNGKDIVGYQMENWSDGKLHGAFSIKLSLSATKAEVRTASINLIGWSLLGSIIILIAAAIYLQGRFQILEKMSDRLEVASQQLSSASEQISASAQSLSESTVKSASNLEETTASAEEIASMIRVNGDNANSAKVLASQCQSIAENGREEVEKLISSVESVSTNFSKIADITNVIDDIAFQTNLLALNAAVEAARAGEQGRGFSVVADAVRSLAQRSSQSAKEISTLIGANFHHIQMTSDLAKKSGVALDQIVDSVVKVNNLNGEIANASQEQTIGVEGINKSINELDKVTQQNAAISEETAAASVEFYKKSTELREVVEGVHHLLDGQRIKDDFSLQNVKEEDVTSSNTDWKKKAS